MKKPVLLLLACFAGLLAIAQNLPAEIKVKCAEPLNRTVLVIVNGFETEMQCLALHPNNIEKIDVLKGQKAILDYGTKADGGVIIITTKPGTEFYTIADFVNPEKNINRSVSKVQLNNMLLTDMNKILVDKSVFKQTMVSTEFKTDEEQCSLSTGNTLIVMTSLKEHKE